eukprot:1975587-Rhodomonas_salina.1
MRAQHGIWEAMWQSRLRRVQSHSRCRSGSSGNKAASLQAGRAAQKKVGNVQSMRCYIWKACGISCEQGPMNRGGATGTGAPDDTILSNAECTGCAQ